MNRETADCLFSYGNIFLDISRQMWYDSRWMLGRRNFRCRGETYGLDFGVEESPPISKLYGDQR